MSALKAMQGDEEAQKDIVHLMNEIDRYIAWPGQALAYMVGRMAFQAVRELAKRKLGDRFDLRRFHDALLKRGSVPIQIMGQNMEQWIEREASATSGTEGALEPVRTP